MSYVFRSSASKRICISFDWHNDRNYRNMLSAWLADPKNPVNFTDLTPGAIDTDDVARVKGVLTTQIRAATHTLVLIGAHANDYHKDRAEIGARNWIWWEIQKSKEEGNGLIAVKIDQSYSAPDPILDAGASWAMRFGRDEILQAIDRA